MILAGLTSALLPLEYVRGRSMAPTLRPGQWLVVANAPLLKWLHQPVKHGDIVVFQNAGRLKQINRRQLLVKRVIGTPGDLISLNRTTVFRNAKALKEPYVTHAMNNEVYDYDGRINGGELFHNVAFERTTLLMSGQYFVLGDNRPRSADSRWFGPITASQIAGKVLWRLPLSNRDWWARGLWTLIHFLPLLLVLAWFAVAYGPELRRLVRGQSIN